MNIRERLSTQVLLDDEKEQEIHDFQKLFLLPVARSRAAAQSSDFKTLLILS
jgi:hypothetical protein